MVVIVDVTHLHLVGALLLHKEVCYGFVVGVFFVCCVEWLCVMDVCVVYECDSVLLASVLWMC